MCGTARGARRAGRCINEAAHAGRLARHRVENTVRYEGTHPQAGPATQVFVQAATPAKPADQNSSGAGDDLMAQLTKLAELRTDGLLSESEFVAAKAKLLG